MKLKRALIALLLSTVHCALFTVLAAAQTPLGYVQVSDTYLQDSSRNYISNATISFAPVACPTGQAISYQVNGRGQATDTPVTAQVTSGVFTILLADTALTFPVNIGYKVTVTDNTSGDSLLGPGYICYQPAGSGAMVSGGQCTAAGVAGGACNFDLFQPNLAPLALVQTGPVGPAGPNTLSGSTTTALNGILKGNGSTVGTATAGTDYDNTGVAQSGSGTSGTAAFPGNVTAATSVSSPALKITGQGVSTSPVCPNGTGGALTISGCSGGGGGGAGLSPTSGNAFGDSLTLGSQGITLRTSAHPYLVGAAFGLTSSAINDYAAGGAQACDVASQVFGNDSPTAPLYPQPLRLAMIGTNDAGFSEPSSYDPTFDLCLRGYVSWLAIPLTSKVVGSAATATGTCSTDTTYGAVTGEKCTGNGNTIAFSGGSAITTPSGILFLWNRYIDSDTGTWTYQVDSGSTVSVNTATSPAIATHNGATTSVGLIEISGLTTGSHTVTFTKTSAGGTMSVIAIGTPPTAGTSITGGQPFLVMDQFPPEASGTNASFVANFQSRVRTAFNHLGPSSAPGLALPVALSTAASTNGKITTSTSGGSLPTASAYRLAATYVLSNGGETAASIDTAGTAVVTTGAGSTNSIAVTSPATPSYSGSVGVSVIGWRLYMSAAGGAAGSEILYAPTCTAPAATYVPPLTGICALAATATITAVITGTDPVPSFDGLNLLWGAVDTTTPMTSFQGDFADTLHPNANGQIEIASAETQALSPPNPVPAPATVVYGDTYSNASATVGNYTITNGCGTVYIGGSTVTGITLPSPSTMGAGQECTVMFGEGTPIPITVTGTPINIPGYGPASGSITFKASAGNWFMKSAIDWTSLSTSLCTFSAASVLTGSAGCYQTYIGAATGLTLPTNTTMNLARAYSYTNNSNSAIPITVTGTNTGIPAFLPPAATLTVIPTAQSGVWYFGELAGVGNTVADPYFNTSSCTVSVGGFYWCNGAATTATFPNCNTLYANSQVEIYNGTTVALAVSITGSSVGMPGNIPVGGMFTAKCASNAFWFPVSSSPGVVQVLSDPAGTPTYTAGTNVTSCGCASTFTCTNTKGRLTIVGGTATTGTICTLNFSATLKAAPKYATVNEMGATSLHGLDHGLPTTTAVTVTSAVTVTGATLSVDYSLIP